MISIMIAIVVVWKYLKFLLLFDILFVNHLYLNGFLSTFYCLFLPNLVTFLVRKFIHNKNFFLDRYLERNIKIRENVLTRFVNRFRREYNEMYKTLVLLDRKFVRIIVTILILINSFINIEFFVAFLLFSGDDIVKLFYLFIATTQLITANFIGLVMVKLSRLMCSMSIKLYRTQVIHSSRNIGRDLFLKWVISAFYEATTQNCGFQFHFGVMGSFTSLGIMKVSFVLPVFRF